MGVFGVAKKVGKTRIVYNGTHLREDVASFFVWEDLYGGEVKWW